MSLSDWSASELPFENTMGLGVGDLFDDGYPDLWIGTGNPPRAAPDIVLCNRGDAQFERCESQIIQGADLTWKTRSHGAVFSDFDHDGDTDFAVNLGGNPPFDASEGERISPEWPGLFVNERGPSGNTAALTLVGTRSNRDAIGARIRVEGSDSRHYVVGSMQAFQSQNSRVQIVTLGDAREARVEIRWPAGGSQTLTVRAGERISVTEP
jgi:hypothetical protein